ncbi:MAG: transcriptional regulator with XRE-family HTH domain [Urechidicola sp.]|jgi:transcriptional regulator with XRE-family HTH domain|tara:strand:+ start:820 stop:1188 length:369 start_codon:yes stop_codon:yes gene_type:complete
MVNNLQFSERLKKMMEFYGLTATALAESIDVQRSSISHLLSGRNKPSLDFVLKILESYQEVELYWLLKGEGTFPKEKIKNSASPKLLDPKKAKFDLNEVSEDETIEKIIIFYKNGAFKSFEP